MSVQLPLGSDLALCRSMWLLMLQPHLGSCRVLLIIASAVLFSLQGR